MENKTDFLLVIPAYREGLRLPSFLKELVESLRNAPFSTTILIVDDGSPQEERLEFPGKLKKESFGSCTVSFPLLLPAHEGKGAAVLAGWRRGVESRWRVFVDADGAVSAGEVRRVLGLIFERGDETGCFFGSRVRMPGRRVKRRFFRGICGEIFATLVRACLAEDIHDFQCGFKILPSVWFGKVNAGLKEKGLCFDIELLLALRQAGAKILEVPLDWEEKSGGSTKVLRDGPAMLLGLVRLRERFGGGRKR